MLAAKSVSQSPDSEAYAAYWNADFHRALALFHNVDAPGATVMRARIFMRLRLCDRALAEVERRCLSELDSYEGTGLAIVAAHAHTELREENRVRDALNVAEQIARRSSDRGLAAYSAQTRCFLALSVGDFEQSRGLLEESVALASALEERAARKPYDIDFVGLRTRAYGLQPWHDALESDYATEEKHLLGTAICAADPRNRDRFIEANALSNLSILVANRPFQLGRQHLVSRLETFPWTRHTVDAEVKCCNALRNNVRLFQSEKEISERVRQTALSLALRLAERADALLFGNWGDQGKFLEELRHSVAVAFDVDWPNATLELPSLLSLAALLAPFDQNISSKAKEMFYGRYDDVPRAVIGRLEPRGAALELLADACIAKARGAHIQATTRFGAIADIAYPDRHLEAIAGIERFTMTRAPSDLAAAQLFIGRFPHSSFSRRLQRSLAGIERAAPGDFPYLGMYGIGKTCAGR